MLYTELKIGNDTYKLRLTTKGAIALEKSLGFNPITMLIDIDKGIMPKLGDVLTVLHGALQAYHHGMNFEATCDLYEKYIEDGHGMFDLIPLFVEVFQNGGYLSTKTEAANEGIEEDGKN